MEIKFYGNACFSVEEKGITVVMDPFGEEVDASFPSVKAEVVTLSQNTSAYNQVSRIGGEPRVFSWPGEYETKGVHFRLIPSYGAGENEGEVRENNITLIFFEGIKICHLGNLAKKLTPEQLEQLGQVDVLLLPVGDKKGLGPKKAKEVFEQIEPRVVIPMLYASDNNALPLEPLSAFLSEMGAAGTELLDSFKFKKSELPEDNSKVIALNVQK